MSTNADANAQNDLFYAKGDDMKLQYKQRVGAIKPGAAALPASIKMKAGTYAARTDEYNRFAIWGQRLGK